MFRAQPVLSCVVVLLLALSFLAGSPGSGRGAAPVNVGIVTDGPWARNSELATLFENEILELTRGEFEVRFPESALRSADWTMGGVRAAVDALLADPSVDLVITLGVLASHDVARRGPLPKPVIAPVVIDAEAQGLPRSGESSGVHNLNYLTYPRTLRNDLLAFRELTPFDRLTVLSNGLYLDGLPGLGDEFARIARDEGFTLQVVRVEFSVEDALARIPADAQAVYITPLLQLSDADFNTLVAALNRRGIPTFSLLGENEVRRGVLASTNPDIFPRLARRVALNVQQVLLGDDPATIPVGFSGGRQWFVNMGTARTIGVYPSWAILTEAVQFDEGRPEIRREVSLDSVVREALATNLDLAAADREVTVARHETGEARANLLPRVDLSGRGTLIDKDRAEAGLGNAAERTLVGSATLTQVLYSDDAWTGYHVQEHLETARMEDRRARRLDVIQEAAAAYLNVLRAKAGERIQRDNLNLTRSNLSLARVRQSVGSSGPADVYRFESQIATNRKSAIEANAARNVAEIALNRVLHRSLEEPFRTAEADVEDPGLLSGTREFRAMLTDKGSFARLREALVRSGLEASPELKAFDAGIAVQDRLLANARRSWVLPSLALRGEVSNRFATGGAGSEGGALDLPPGLDFSFPEADDTDWSLSLALEFPLVTGGERLSRSRRVREEMSKLEIERRAAAERIEQRIRSALHFAGASYAGIEQARLASEAARNNLELVTDAYARGTVSVIELLDAQNASLVAEASAANAVYDFLLDLVEVQRSISNFGFFTGGSAGGDWIPPLDSP